ncbi:MAG: GxxExxY protein [Phycisphaerae bacterium]|nr:GxxExxY protein [Phycisphaerae bacterium]
MYEHSELTKKIIKAAHNVHNSLGYGFLEKVYHRALVIELQSMGLSVAAEKAITVYYTNQIVGEYFADIVVSDKVIVETKFPRVKTRGIYRNRHCLSTFGG